MSTKATVVFFLFFAVTVLNVFLLVAVMTQKQPVKVTKVPSEKANIKIPTKKVIKISDTMETLTSLERNLDSNMATLKADAIAKSKREATKNLIKKLLQNPTKKTKETEAALNLIHKSNDTDSYKKELFELERSGPKEFKSKSVAILINLPGSEGIAFARKYLKSEDKSLRQTVIHGMAGRREKEDLKATIPILIEALNDQEPLIRKIAANALNKISGKQFRFSYTKQEKDNQVAIVNIKQWAVTHGYGVKQ